ncbi:MAG TPA: iron chelate uptake ABC transporter family permease subunit [Abditibacteriaceae bacterium]|jgi:manganese/zinc/iron transport system permease protein
MDAFWIIAIGSLVAASCALCGTFLVLRRMTMLGDAISHAVLPGIAIAFLLTKSRQSVVMLFGAAIFGLITTFIVEALSRGGRVRNDAAIGVTFTSLFAIGVVLISRYASNVDLDTDCVLYGVIETTTLYTTPVFGLDVPQAFLQILGVFLLCLLFVALFFKELKIASFDPEMATAVGINAMLMHYLLMGLVSITAVASFEPVGAILVVAMLAVPPATAYLLTDNLSKMLVLSVFCGVLSAAGGYFLAVWLNVSTAGAMTVVTGVFFTIAFLISPRYGVLTRHWERLKLARSVAREDVLQALWRVRERSEKPLDVLGLAAIGQMEISLARRAVRDLLQGGLAAPQNGGFMLTSAGLSAAQELVHRHRVYEAYLGDLGYPDDHLHDAANRTEHFISRELEQAVDSAVGNPTRDPHGREIPHD